MARGQKLARARTPHITIDGSKGSGQAGGSEVSPANLWRGVARCVSRGTDSAAAPVNEALKRGASHPAASRAAGEARARVARDQRNPGTGEWRRRRTRRRKDTRKRWQG